MHSTKQKFVHNLGLWSDIDHDNSPEKRLWRCVVVKFYRDLYKSVKQFRESRNGLCSVHLREIELLQHELNSFWFENVCDFAGLHYGKVKDSAKEIVDSKREINFPNM